MEGYTYSSSFPDSGDSSPGFREGDADHSVASWDDQPPPPPPSSARAKLLCSYGGRIQPRQHDNQLAYVGGETKILNVERSVRFPAILSRLASLSGADDLVLKYQLPGEELDALVSVTNDEDLDHMMYEYDRLHHQRGSGSGSGSGKPVARLRLFLFAPSIGGGKIHDGATCIADAPSVTDHPPVESVTVSAPLTEKGAPDYLFGLENEFEPPPAVNVREIAPEYAAFPEAPPARSEIESVISPAEMQRHVNEIQRLQIAENNHNLQVNNNNNMPRNGSDETLARVYPGEYYVPRVQEQAPAVQNPVYWAEHQRSMAPPAGRFTSVAGVGDQQLFYIPATHGVYPPAPAVQGGYYTTMQRMVPAAAYDSSLTSAAATQAAPVYTMAAPAQAAKAAYDSGVQVAYDSSGRAVYYQAVGANVAMNPESKALKPSQVS